MPKISVISTVYNGAQYLKDYFLSIENQSFYDFELILIDDGSTDESGRMCDEYAKKDCRIYVYHQENQGLAAARNNAVSCTHTDWITFVDCDDAIHPQYLDVLYQGIMQNNTQISGTGVLETGNLQINEHVKLSAEWQKYNVDENFLMGSLCSGYFGQIACAKLVNKSILLANPFTAGKVFEDNAVVKKWIYGAGTVSYTDDKLYYYRINSEGLSKGRFDADRVKDVLWSRDEIIDFYKEKGLKKAYTEAERSYILFAVNLYFKLKKVDLKNAEKLKKRILERYKTDKTTIPFSKDDERFVMELKHPRLMWLYWKIKAIMGNIY